MKRNIERFPEDFMSQLTKGELEILRSQFVILKKTDYLHTRLQLDAISTALAVLGFAACYQRDARTAGRASPTAPTQADRIHTT